MHPLTASELTFVTRLAAWTLSGSVLYDSNVQPGFNPIEFLPNLPTLNAPSPQSLSGGPNGSLLFVPFQCGGDQPACNTPGAFPGNGMMDYMLTSGTYTSVDLGPSPVPEPGSVMLVTTGVSMLGWMFRRRGLTAR